MADIHNIRNQARRLRLTKRLSSVEGRMVVANLLHRARCKERGLEADDIPTEALIQILQKQGYRCCYCPDKIMNDFELDHRVPVGEGDGHTPDNIQFACKQCNRLKRDKERPELHQQPAEYYYEGMAIKMREPVRMW